MDKDRLVVAIISIVNCFLVLINGQAIEELLDIILSNEEHCGSALDDIEWLPEALDKCGNKVCRFPYQICQVGGNRLDRDSRLYRCFSLKSECVDIIKKELTGQVRPNSWKDPPKKNRQGISRAELFSSKSGNTGSGIGFVYIGTVQSSTQAPMMMMEPLGPSTPITEGGVDEHKFCCKWAREGACNDRPKYMRTKCQKSCGTIGCEESFFRHCHVRVNLDHCPTSTHKPLELKTPVVPNRFHSNPYTPYNNIALHGLSRNSFLSFALKQFPWGPASNFQFNRSPAYPATGFNPFLIYPPVQPAKTSYKAGNRAVISVDACSDSKPPICKRLYYRGACRSHYAIMSQYCKLSCGFCNATPQRRRVI